MVSRRLGFSNELMKVLNFHSGCDKIHKQTLSAGALHSLVVIVTLRITVPVSPLAS